MTHHDEDIPIRADQTAGVLTITLNACARGNPIGVREARLLRQAVDVLDKDVKVVHLRAAGPNFSVGGDVRDFLGTSPSQNIDAIVGEFHEAVLALSRLEVLTVSSVRGWAVGGGLGLATVADIVIASETARFKPGYVNLALTSDGGTAWQLVRAIGRVRAMDLMVSGGELDAETALNAGLVSRVVPDDCLDAVAEELIAGLAAGPRVALRAAKGLIREAWRLGLPEHLSVEHISMVDAASTDDFREGVTAFLEKRAPRFEDGSGSQMES